jgi:heparosan-N-sulfate-glucuronate 5-epimerase
VTSDPHAYHFDLREKPLHAGEGLAERISYLRRITVDPGKTNPVTVIQLALGALQLRDSSQLPLVIGAVEWLEGSVDAQGMLAYRFPMPHTFPLDAPWYSSLAQGEAVSLLVRAAEVLNRAQLLELADRLAEPLLQPESPLLVMTAEGPVLQEYPTDPPAHVLNGWITSLFGLYDLAHSKRDSSASVRRAAAAFDAGTKALAARLRLYRTPLGWSRYDLYPHPLPNTASVAYHRLHIAQLRALHSLASLDAFVETADDWERSLANPFALAVGLGRKVAFRLVRPRFRRAAAQPPPAST